MNTQSRPNLSPPRLKTVVGCLEQVNVIATSQQAVSFVFERARAPRHFLLDKGHPIFFSAFQGHQGYDQGAWKQISFIASLKYRGLGIGFKFHPSNVGGFFFTRLEYTAMTVLYKSLYVCNQIVFIIPEANLQQIHSSER